MIVKNEENNISRCLSSVKNIFDEIIIVDTGSKDNTKKIVEKFTDKIYDFNWVNDFSKARNYAFSKATGDYLMWLDADDILTSEDALKLKKLKENLNSEIDIYLLKYNISFDEENNPTFSYYRERIIKNDKKHYFLDRVHEYVPLIGKLSYEDIAITHSKIEVEKSNRNLKIYEEMIKENELFTPRNKYYYGRELFEHQKYKKCIKVLNEFLDEGLGWIEDNINACVLIYYSNLNLQTTNSLKSLFQTFEYDLPRKKICCLIGEYYFKIKNYENAIYWYNSALMTKIVKDGFYEEDYDYFIPYLNLCLCHYRLNELELAKKYHSLCKKIKPNSSIVLYNNQFFEEIE